MLLKDIYIATPGLKYGSRMEGDDRALICVHAHMLSGGFRGGSKGSMEPPFWLQ